MKGSFRKEELLVKMSYLIVLFAGKMLLDIAYYYYISPNYAYMKLETSVSFIKFLESNMLLYILFIYTTAVKNRIGTFFLSIQLVITILPMLSFYWLNDQNRIFMYVVCICHLIEVCLLKWRSFSGTFTFFPSRLAEYCTYELVIIFVSMILFFCIYKYGVPQLTALDFSKVYEIRKNISWSFPLNYFIPWCAKILIPLGIVLGLSRKRYISVVMLQVMLFVFYLQFPHKAFFFTIVFVTAVYIACYKKIIYQAIYLVVPGVTLIGMIAYKFFGSIMPLSYLVRRVLFVPAQLKFVYYDFFSQNPKYCFADGQIGKLLGIENKYDLSIGKTIGSYMGTNSSANTGYLGEAYAQAGFLGMILISVLLVVLLKMIDLLTYEKDSIYIIAASSYWLYSLNDSALFTGMLTGGGIMLLAVFALQGKGHKEVLME